MSAELLVIMAKYPTPGKVKTRLARDIGKAAAARAYRALLMIHAEELAAAPFEVQWRYTPSRAPFRRLVPAVHRVRPQPGGGLGDRLYTIFEESFARGFERVVITASDSPDVSCRMLKRAFSALKRVGAVVQPTEDGGYALVGLTTVVDLFSGISWSTPLVMAQTRERFLVLGLRHLELPMTYDVDTIEDLRRAARSHPELL
jgi:uncharacterized protein